MQVLYHVHCVHRDTFYLIRLPVMTISSWIFLEECVAIMLVPSSSRFPVHVHHLKTSKTVSAAVQSCSGSSIPVPTVCDALMSYCGASGQEKTHHHSFPP